MSKICRQVGTNFKKKKKGNERMNLYSTVHRNAIRLDFGLKENGQMVVLRGVRKVPVCCADWLCPWATIDAPPAHVLLGNLKPNPSPITN